jgi:hypothetical protein
MRSRARRQRLIVTVVGLVLAAAYSWTQRGMTPSETTSGGSAGTPSGTQRSGTQMSGIGVVRRVLPDDNDGSRHQRFILELAEGQTVLVAHNIDLAPRLTSLDPGDTVAFYGEYESNAQGGVIHWTHHDPARRHVDGWLKHEGRTVQ